MINLIVNFYKKSHASYWGAQELTMLWQDFETFLNLLLSRLN